MSGNENSRYHPWAVTACLICDSHIVRPHGALPLHLFLRSALELAAVTKLIHLGLHAFTDTQESLVQPSSVSAWEGRHDPNRRAGARGDVLLSPSLPPWLGGHLLPRPSQQALSGGYLRTRGSAPHEATAALLPGSASSGLAAKAPRSIFQETSSRFSPKKPLPEKCKD